MTVHSPPVKTWYLAAHKLPSFILRIAIGIKRKLLFLGLQNLYYNSQFETLPFSCKCTYNHVWGVYGFLMTHWSAPDVCFFGPGLGWPPEAFEGRPSQNFFFGSNGSFWPQSQTHGCLLLFWEPESLDNLYNVPTEPERAEEARKARRSCEFKKNS